MLSVIVIIISSSNRDVSRLPQSSGGIAGLGVGMNTCLTLPTARCTPSAPYRWLAETAIFGTKSLHVNNVYGFDSVGILGSRDEMPPNTGHAPEVLTQRILYL